jgi:hypothetical protein
MHTQSDLSEQFPIGSKVRDSRYGKVEFEVIDYWRGDLRLKEPRHGTTHCCPVSGATLIAVPRTILVHLNVELPPDAPFATEDVVRDLTGCIEVGQGTGNTPALDAGKWTIALAEEV